VRSTAVHNRFYSLRDLEPFVKRSQADYDSARPVFDTDLTDITASPPETRVPADSPGWKLDLAFNGAAPGEKVLAESLTASGVVLFTTYQPGTRVDGAECDVSATNRVYAVRVDSGNAALDLNGDLQITQADRSAMLEQTGSAVEPRIELAMPVPKVPGSPSPPGAPGIPGAPASDSALAQPRCLVGAELMNQCVPIDTVIRTYWKRLSVN
jgi:Tfp pilus tip-associated adhesin PilY1